MRIAVVNEVSARAKNDAILAALEGLGHTVYNAGMDSGSDLPELTYIETGLLSALLLNAGRVDLVIGGCGTGQGYLNSVMQYPGVFCGLVETPLDALLFSKINGGNCISLALNKGFGWAGDINLRFLMERFFSSEPGVGYPPERAASQAQSRERLARISKAAHLPFDQILLRMDRQTVKNVLEFPGVMELLDAERLDDAQLKEAILQIMGAAASVPGERAF